MNYHSTRNHKLKLSSKEAIMQGLAPEGGLFVPDSIPNITLNHLKEWVSLDYRKLAWKILTLFLTDYSPEELDECVNQAYFANKFSSPDIAPVVELKDGLHVLELWHGPTSAFKDMALQILPHFMTTALRSCKDQKEIVILTATSGDTGKAALEGFQDVDGTRIMVFYPDQGVSTMQRLQMVTQKGNNVQVAAVNGNFDDAQTGVKQIFRDQELLEQMDRKNLRFSSANSINWGRLVPQIVYYISAYLDLVKQEKITLGQPINVVVPTGNFGNILAAWYARKMGLPLNRLICASNGNHVLTDFIQTGVYDRRREFHLTISPSMDILVSSNLERLLYEISGRDDEQVNEWMEQLVRNGYYKIEGSALEALQSILWGGYAGEEQTREAIRSTFQNTGYTMDPHTAVGKWVYDKYRQETADETITILVSTASPFKFPGDVLHSLQGENFSPVTNELHFVAQLAEMSGMEIPLPLRNLYDKVIKHTDKCEISEMKDEVAKFMDIQEMES